jgi:hypothetical protein
MNKSNKKGSKNITLNHIHSKIKDIRNNCLDLKKEIKDKMNKAKVKQKKREIDKNF